MLSSQIHLRSILRRVSVLTRNPVETSRIRWHQPRSSCYAGGNPGPQGRGGTAAGRWHWHGLCQPAQGAGRQVHNVAALPTSVHGAPPLMAGDTSTHACGVCGGGGTRSAPTIAALRCLRQFGMQTSAVKPAAGGLPALCGQECPPVLARHPWHPLVPCPGDWVEIRSALLRSGRVTLVGEFSQDTIHAPSTPTPSTSAVRP